MTDTSFGCKKEGEGERKRAEGNKSTWAEVNLFNRLTEDRHVAKEPIRFPKLQGNLGLRSGGPRQTGNWAHRFAAVTPQIYHSREHILALSSSALEEFSKGWRTPTPRIPTGERGRSGIDPGKPSHAADKALLSVVTKLPARNGVPHEATTKTSFVFFFRVSRQSGRAEVAIFRIQKQEETP